MSGDGSDQGAAVDGKRFKVEDLGVGAGQGAEKASFAAASGPEEDVVLEALRQIDELLVDPSAVRLPPALEYVDVVANGAQVVGPKCRALAAAEAVDKDGL